MQHKLIRRAAMFITSVLAMTVLFAVPIFAATCSAGGLTFTVEAVDSEHTITGATIFEIDDSTLGNRRLFALCVGFRNYDPDGSYKVNVSYSGGKYSGTIANVPLIDGVPKEVDDTKYNCFNHWFIDKITDDDG
ncbi:MAG: hypothetical protein IJM34_02165, partial [Lachnospiraceae bacterium]|nr:hypothetical protein [Lachnospiraceae bacterium]